MHLSHCEEPRMHVLMGSTLHHGNNLSGANAYHSDPPALAFRVCAFAAVEDEGSLLRGVAISCSLLDVSIASRESSAPCCRLSKP